MHTEEFYKQQSFHRFANKILYILSIVSVMVIAGTIYALVLYNDIKDDSKNIAVSDEQDDMITMTKTSTECSGEHNIQGSSEYSDTEQMIWVANEVFPKLSPTTNIQPGKFILDNRYQDIDNISIIDKECNTINAGLDETVHYSGLNRNSNERTVLNDDKMDNTLSLDTGISGDITGNTIIQNKNSAITKDENSIITKDEDNIITKDEDNIITKDENEQILHVINDNKDAFVSIKSNLNVLSTNDDLAGQHNNSNSIATLDTVSFLGIVIVFMYWVITSIGGLWI